MRIKVNASLCTGHARCLAVAPNVYKLNEDGYNEMPETEVPSNLQEEARRGARACPERAIALIND